MSQKPKTQNLDDDGIGENEHTVIVKRPSPIEQPPPLEETTEVESEFFDSATVVRPSPKPVTPSAQTPAPAPAAAPIPTQTTEASPATPSAPVPPPTQSVDHHAVYEATSPSIRTQRTFSAYSTREDDDGSYESHNRYTRRHQTKSRFQEISRFAPQAAGVFLIFLILLALNGVRSKKPGTIEKTHEPVVTDTIPLPPKAPAPVAVEQPPVQEVRETETNKLVTLTKGEFLQKLTESISEARNLRPIKD